jgi:hypothetical protein
MKQSPSSSLHNFMSCNQETTFAIRFQKHQKQFIQVDRKGGLVTANNMTYRSDGEKSRCFACFRNGARIEMETTRRFLCVR